MTINFNVCAPPPSPTAILLADSLPSRGQYKHPILPSPGGKVGGLVYNCSIFQRSNQLLSEAIAAAPTVMGWDIAPSLTGRVLWSSPKGTNWLCVWPGGSVDVNVDVVLGGPHMLDKSEVTY